MRKVLDGGKDGGHNAQKVGPSLEMVGLFERNHEGYDQADGRVDKAGDGHNNGGAVAGLFIVDSVVIAIILLVVVVIAVAVGALIIPIQRVRRQRSCSRKIHQEKKKTKPKVLSD